MTKLEVLASCEQDPLEQAPYDRWVAPDGSTTAMFYRLPGGYQVRFPAQADFEIDAGTLAVRCKPVPGAPPQTANTLFQNSIRPLIANYVGELNLHASAVFTGDAAVAFLGFSRRGKTTLATAFARAGFPFLTEDVLRLETEDHAYRALPSRPVLRLFRDSASALFDPEGFGESAQQMGKEEFAAGDDIPFRDQPARLERIYLLGTGQNKLVEVVRLAPADALARLMQHSFILDVEDKGRLRAHFQRIAALADSVPCFELDYPRNYEQLPGVLHAVLTHADSSGQVCATK